MASNRTDRSLIRLLDLLVRGIGKPPFDAAVADIAAHLCDAVAAAGYLYEDGQLATLSAASRPGDEAAGLAAFRYSGRLWRSDPDFQRDISGLRDGERRLTVIGRDSLKPEIAARVLDLMAAGSQASLYRRQGEAVFCLRCYLPCHGPEAQDRSTETLIAYGDLLTAALIRHAELKKRAQSQLLRPAARREISATLMKLERRLTPREIEVCSAILLGKSVEAIGLDMGIAMSSVTTYRKRAYRRLGISSQSQLFALCFNEVGAR